MLGATLACNGTAPGGDGTATATSSGGSGGMASTSSRGASGSSGHASSHNTTSAPGSSTLDTGTSSSSAPGSTGSTAGQDAGTVPAEDCADLQGAQVTVCGPTANGCGLVFEGGLGCAAACARAGRSCVASYEDVTGQCAPDTTRPALGCANTGHGTDWCECGPGTGERPDAGPAVGTPDEDCTRYPFRADTLLAERAGFGRNARGGDPSRIYRVTTLSGDTSGAGDSGSLRRALESTAAYWIVFDVEGTITFNTRVAVQSNKTVDGRGRDIHIRGNLRFEDASNIILSDVRFSNDLEGHCTQAGDVLTFIGAGSPDPAAFTTRNIFINHVELFNGGDGLLDLRGASLVTVAWSHFHQHKKGLLMWGDRDNNPTPGMRVTMHHNFFDRITLRGPQMVYGWMHYFNNYQYRWYEYGAGSLGGAQFASEGNIYEARPNCGVVEYAQGACQDPNPCGDNDVGTSVEALVTEWAGNGVGNTRSTGDLLLGGAQVSIVNPTGVFEPAAQYTYAAETATAALAQEIAARAGPRTTYCR